MNSARILRRKIDAEQLTLGLIVTNHWWLDLIEISRNAGLDYLIIDTEHTGYDDERIAEACSVGRMLDFPILIRVPETQFSYIRRAADKGACGLLLPTVRDTAMLDEVRDALYMPPRGRRRPGGAGNRWVSDYNYTTWQQQVEDDFIVLPQIEDLRGLENVEAIAGHAITTAIAVGPYDLSANLGVCWEPTSPKLQGALGRIRAAGRAAGKNMWMIGDGPTLIAAGYTLLCIGEPSGLLEATLKANAAAMRGGQPATAPQIEKVD